MIEHSTVYVAKQNVSGLLAVSSNLVRLRLHPSLLAVSFHFVVLATLCYIKLEFL